jgi:ABC-2 type transport system permease protein
MFAIIAQVLGFVMLIPQGILPIIFLAAGVQSKSWFLALYLPESLSLVAAIAFVLVGGILAFFGTRKVIRMS